MPAKLRVNHLNGDPKTQFVNVQICEKRYIYPTSLCQNQVAAHSDKWHMNRRRMSLLLGK